MTVERPKPKQLLRPITTGSGIAMNQSQFLAITCNSLVARVKSRVHGAVCFGFDSHWLKNWRESFKPIIKRGNRNHVITFDSQLKTALNPQQLVWYQIVVFHFPIDEAAQLSSLRLIWLTAVERTVIYGNWNWAICCSVNLVISIVQISKTLFWVSFKCMARHGRSAYRCQKL